MLTNTEPAASWIESAVRVLICARGLRVRLAAEATRFGLAGTELELLWACAQAPRQGYSQGELAQILAVSPAQISGLVERLCAAGLLQCLAAEGDRRLRLWRLMPAGQAIWRMLNDDSNPREEAA